MILFIVFVRQLGPSGIRLRPTSTQPRARHTTRPTRSHIIKSPAGVTMDRRSFVCTAALAGAQGVLAQATPGAPEATPKHKHRKTGRLPKAPAASPRPPRRPWPWSGATGSRHSGAGAAGGGRPGGSHPAHQGGHRAARPGRAAGRGALRRPHRSGNGRRGLCQAAEWTADPEMRRAVDGLLAWIRVKAPRRPTASSTTSSTRRRCGPTASTERRRFWRPWAATTRRWPRSRASGSGCGTRRSASSPTSGTMASGSSRTATSGRRQWVGGGRAGARAAQPAP